MPPPRVLEQQPAQPPVRIPKFRSTQLSSKPSEKEVRDVAVSIGVSVDASPEEQRKAITSMAQQFVSAPIRTKKYGFTPKRDDELRERQRAI